LLTNHNHVLKTVLVVVDLKREASAAKAAVADLTVAEAAVVAGSIVIVVAAAAEAAAAAAVDTTVINPVTEKTVKSGNCRTFCFYSAIENSNS
jgi:hypothetical protein